MRVSWLAAYRAAGIALNRALAMPVLRLTSAWVLALMWLVIMVTWEEEEWKISEEALVGQLAATKKSATPAAM
eukprot:1378824-Pleurochrysis_carterae.AAC.1